MSAPLGRLRLRLTIFYGLASALALVALSLVTISVDRRLSAERADQELIGYASRGTILVDFINGTANVGGLANDVISRRVEWWVFGSPKGQGLTAVAGPPAPDGVRALAAKALTDDEETGSLGWVTTGAGGRLRAAAMPVYVDNTISGAVVVAAPRPKSDGRLARFVWMTAGALGALSTLVGWWLAGRTIRPAIASLAQEERFLTAAAHELRTPISRVRAVAESAALLCRDLKPDGVTAELTYEISRLNQLSIEASTVVDQLLLVARLDAGHLELRREPVDLYAIAERLRAHHPTLATTFDEGINVRADPVLLERAVENLVTNAERHGVRNGQPPSIIWSMRLDANDVTLQVSDDGPGIPEAMRTELFERFRSNDPHGSGVGLWLVRWIVEQHGGTISAESNNGAVITARFPQGANSPPTRNPEAAASGCGSVAAL